MDTVGTEQMNQPRGTLFAITLIVAGVILFLDNVGVLQIESVAAYLPLVFVVCGIGILIRKTTVTAAIWATAFASFGVLLTLGNLGLIHAGVSVAWPILLIAIGVTALVHRGYWANGLPEPGHWKWQDQAFAAKHQLRRWHRQQHHRRWDKFRRFGEGYVNETAVFFSISRRMDGRELRNGEVVAVFGSVEIDFTGSTIPLTVPEDGGSPVRRAELEATAVFGSVEIRVPANWRVIKDGAGVFGSYDDRTLPFRPEPGVEPPTLVLRGGAVFGSVTIEN